MENKIVASPRAYFSESMKNSRIAHHKPGMNGMRNGMMLMMMIMMARRKDATKHRYVSSLQNGFDGLYKHQIKCDTFERKSGGKRPYPILEETENSLLCTSNR